MSIDLLRAEANERVDLLDFQYLANTVFQDALRVCGNGFLTNPNSALRSWVIDGFALANPTGKQLQVTKGRAILAWRTGGTVRHGIITTEGDATKIVDLTALAVATYNVYIRFEYVDGDNSSRIFWNADGSGSEFTQTMGTRLKANWSMRVETGSPGAEWLQIGTANNAGGSLVIVDQRPLYFEGTPHSTYASGWSTDGGGVANDRNANRQAYGVKDLQAFSAATRQCLEDIKGRGLRRWWARDIGGMNIGFDADPVEDRLAVGDANFYLYGHPTEPYLQGDAVTNARVAFDRTNQWWKFLIGGIVEGYFASNGLFITDNIYAGGSAYYFGGAGSTTYLNYSGTLLDATLNGVLQSRASAGGFYINNNVYAGNNRYYFGNLGSDDLIYFDTTSSYMGYFVSNVEEMRLDGNGLAITNGLHIGDLTTAPTDNALTVFDAACGFFGSAIPRIQFDSDAYIDYNRSTDVLGALIKGRVCFEATDYNLYPGTNQLGELGTTGRRWGLTWANRGMFLANLVTPINQTELVARHAQNCVLACAAITSAGALVDPTNHWNVLSVTRAPSGKYDLVFDQGVGVAAATGNSCSMAVSATFYTATPVVHFEQIGPMVNTATVWTFNLAGVPTDAYFTVTVFGRPNTMP